MTVEAKYTLADSGEGQAAPTDPAQQPPSARQLPVRTRILLYVLAGSVVILALALGLGLGLGLRHGSSSAAATSTSSSASPTSSLLQVQAQDSSAFVLKGSAMLSDPPQTRTYDFILSERLGAPDGYEKTMLVVNGECTGAATQVAVTDSISICRTLGMYPGPTIEVNEGDRIVVNVTNNMPNATWAGRRCHRQVLR